MAQSRYLRRVDIRRPAGVSDVQAGLAAGQEVGKLIGGLAGAIQAQQKNALANKLMTDQSISEQPGAGQTIDLGTLPSDGSSDGRSDGSSNVASDDSLRQAMVASQLSSSSGQPQDLGQLPSSDPMTPGPSGAQQPMPDPGGSDDQLRQAMAASRLSGGSPTVASVAGGPQSNAKAPIAGSSDSMFNPSDYSGGSGKGTVGGLIHTGGTAELDLQKEMLAQQIQKAQLQKALAPEKQPDPLDTALKRAELAKRQYELANPKTEKPDKNPPAVDIANEPVTGQDQLNKHIDGIYGNGAASTLASSINEPATLPDGTPNPNAPVVTADSVTVPTGPNKKITMPIGEAQVYVKQANAIRLKQGLPAYRVPGEDQSVGATAANPYPAKTNLDVYSRAPGTWVRLPNGKVAQVPERKQQ
jgi:hypothetical protein